MTLKELKEKVEVAEETKKIPKAATLMASGVGIVVEKIINQDTIIRVYENGYVLYIAGDHMTVYPLHKCGDYNYGVADTTGNIMNSDYFDTQNWCIRLLLEGEDRIASNQDKNHQSHCVSYSKVSEEWEVLRDNKMDPAQDVVEREYIDELLGIVSDKAARALQLYYGDNDMQEDIAAALGMRKKAVSKLIRTNVLKIRKSIGIETTEIVRVRNKK